jgi:hypothetical protein
MPPLHVASRDAQARTLEMTYASRSSARRSTRSQRAPQCSHAECPDGETPDEERQREHGTNLSRGDGKQQRESRKADVLPLLV